LILLYSVAGGLFSSAATNFVQIYPAIIGFAAGAMIFVVVEELIPESQRGGHSEWATMGVIVGFALMMVLDVGLK
jgi:ZIP family zinc transporter